MTIKLSNEHHPAMIPNADCERGRRESESGGSRIVSSHFDARLKTLAKKKNQTSPMKEREEKEKRGEEKEGSMQNMQTPFANVHSPLFH